MNPNKLTPTIYDNLKIFECTPKNIRPNEFTRSINIGRSNEPTTQYLLSGIKKINFNPIYLKDFAISDSFATVESLNFPKLELVTATFTIGLTQPTLQEINLPSLKSGSFNISSCPNLNFTLNIPNLTHSNNFQFSSVSGLRNIDCPLLTGSSVNFFNCPQLESMSFNSLVRAANFSVTRTATTSINIPSLVSVTNNISANSNPNLTTVNLNSFVPSNSRTYTFSGCALNVASVNHILARGVAANVTGAIFNLNGGTSAAPNGQGIIDKAILTGLNNTVRTN
jgi:hypothetical protein